MTDPAIKAIAAVQRTSLTFEWLRATFKRDHDIRSELKYGHAVPQSIEQLDQYLYSYGPMIESQWKCVALHLSTLASADIVIDYGCGQGLAGLLIDEITGGNLLSAAREVVLIEPSSLALARAASIYSRLCPNAAISPICKYFDDITKNDVPDKGGKSFIHIFSNSLDVETFDPLKLLSTTLKPGYNTIISVSHDRDFNGGTPRIEAVKEALEAPALADEITIRRSPLDHFTCDNPSQSQGVIWICEFEVKDD